MVEIAAPTPPEEIAGELTQRTRIADFKDLEIHLIWAPEAPATMQEIGRIREIEFRAAGAGRQVERDIDRFDIEFPWYAQLVSWDPARREIVALYRAIRCDWALRHGGLSALRTAGLFHFSERFVSQYLSRSVELGRSVVNRSAQRALQGLFSIWSGLGAMTREWPEVDYFFGNVSLYRSLPPSAVTGIIGYLTENHGAEDGLVTAREPVSEGVENVAKGTRDTPGISLDGLLDKAAKEGWQFPPILLSYLKANSGLLAFDAAWDKEFGGAMEVAIAVPTKSVNPKTVKRFIDPYRSTNPARFELPEGP